MPGQAAEAAQPAVPYSVKQGSQRGMCRLANSPQPFFYWLIFQPGLRRKGQVCACPNLLMFKDFQIILFLLILASCQGPSANDDQPSGSNAQAQPVGTTRLASDGEAVTMRLHDSLMARMDVLMSEKQRLRLRLTGLDTSSAPGRRQAARLRRLQADLSTADKQMMRWMNDFSPPDSTKLSAGQQAAFWQAEVQKLRLMQVQTTAALDSAGRVR